MIDLKLERYLLKKSLYMDVADEQRVIDSNKKRDAEDEQKYRAISNIIIKSCGSVNPDECLGLLTYLCGLRMSREKFTQEMEYAIKARGN